MTQPILAFESGQTTLDQNTMNSIIEAQPSVQIFDGTLTDSLTGAGTTQNDLSVNTYIARFTLTGQTTIGRVVLDLGPVGTGQNVTVEIRDNTFSASGSSDGVLLKSVTIPAKILTTLGHTLISIPIDLTGLTARAYYWLRVDIAGNSNNKNIWYGESSPNGSYPTYYRSGSSGAWTSGTALHFYVYAETPGTYTLTHTIWGTNAMTWIIWSGRVISQIWRWCPGPDGTFVICDCLTPVLDVNGVPVKWNIT